MEINIKKISTKMRVAIVISIIWFVFFFILAIGDIGKRRSETTTFLIIAIIPLLVGWGIWWIQNGSTKKQKKEQGPENQSEKQEPIDVTYKSEKQKTADVKNPFGLPLF